MTNHPRPSLGISVNTVFPIAPHACCQPHVVGLCTGRGERTRGAIERKYDIMNIDIKHKHAGHVIVIEGQPFKASAAGQWNLTEIWRALKLDPKKSPASGEQKRPSASKLCRICTAPTGRHPGRQSGQPSSMQRGSHQNLRTWCSMHSRPSLRTRRSPMPWQRSCTNQGTSIARRYWSGFLPRTKSVTAFFEASPKAAL